MQSSIEEDRQSPETESTCANEANASRKRWIRSDTTLEQETQDLPVETRTLILPHFAMLKPVMPEPHSKESYFDIGVMLFAASS